MCLLSNYHAKCLFVTSTRSPIFLTTNSRFDRPPLLDSKTAEYQREGWVEGVCAVTLSKHQKYTWLLKYTALHGVLGGTVSAGESVVVGGGICFKNCLRYG